jgi:hypothetical protein
MTQQKHDTQPALHPANVSSIIRFTVSKPQQPRNPSESLQHFKDHKRSHQVNNTSSLSSFSMIGGLPGPVVKKLCDEMNNQRIDRNERKQIEQLNAYSFVPTEIKCLKDQRKTLDFSLTSKRKYSYLEKA